MIICLSRDRCICPANSWGRRCKVLSRTFYNNGWAWVKPLVPCHQTRVSVKILTMHQNGTVLYSGPLSDIPNKDAYQNYAKTYSKNNLNQESMIILQVVNGKTELIIEGEKGSLKLHSTMDVSDGKWHTIHFNINHYVSLIEFVNMRVQVKQSGHR